MGSTYRAVLGRRDVLSVLVPYLVTRLPLSMASLALLMLVRDQTGSYHRAGLVGAAYGLAVAVAAPVLGRQVDRRGQADVLLLCGLLHPAAMVGLVLAAEAGAFPAVVAAAAVAGACLPPIGACMRVQWTRLLTVEKERQAGFALDAVVVEVAELTGPLLVTAALFLGRPATAVLIGAALAGAGALSFRMSGPCRAVDGSTVDRSWRGALAVPAVRRILSVILLSTATIGAVEIALVAFAGAHGSARTAGVYIAVVSAGGICAGLLFGGIGLSAPRRPALLIASLVATGATSFAMSAVSSTALVVVLLLAFGAAVAVSVVVQLAMMSDAAPESLRTEAFTWGGTANFIGLSLGTVGAGWILDTHGLRTAFLAAAGAALLAGCVAVSTRRMVEPAAEEAADEPDEPIGTELPTEAVEVPAQRTEEVAVRLAAAEDAAVAFQLDIERLQARVCELEDVLSSSPVMTVEDARERARRMLERADTACMEIRERAEDDAARVREAATSASIEILAAAERDARAMLDRARREVEAFQRARRTPPIEGVPEQGVRPALHALPDLDGAADPVAPTWPGRADTR